jgi:hypothetical protein
MKTINYIIISVIFSVSASLYGQSDIKTLFHRQFQENQEFTEENILPQEFYEQSGMLKSANADYGSTPNWIWVKKFGGSSLDAGKAVTIDNNSNIYVAGYFTGILISGDDTLESTGNADLVVMKLGPSCNPLWVKHLSASEGTLLVPESIVLDNLGNIIVTGYFTSPSINAGGTLLNRTGTQDIFIMKFSGSGNLTWAKSYGESDRLFEGPKVKSDAANNYYVIFSSGYTYAKMLVYSANGQLLNNDSQINIKFNDLEISGTNLYVTGTTEANFGSGKYFHDAFLTKMDLLGNTNWLIYGNATAWNGNSDALDISVSSDGSIYLLGTLSKNAIWGEDTLTDRDFLPFITKVNPDTGQIYWTKRLPINNNSNKPYMQLMQDETNNLYLIGYTNSIVNYDGIDINPGNFLLKCNPEGTGLSSGALDFRPIGAHYGSGKIIVAGYDQYLNMIVSRYSSGTALEYSSDIRGNSGTGSISGTEADSAANLYSYGSLSGSGEIFGTPYYNFKGCFLSKQNSHGEPIWIKLIEGGSAGTHILGNSFVLNRGYNCLYLLGSVIDTLETDAGVLLKSDADQFLAKYNINGTCEWVKPLKKFSILSAAITSDKSGNVILTGGNMGNVTIAGTSYTGDDMKNGYMAKFDKDGNLKWSFQISSTNVIYNGVASTDKNNMIYFTGEFLPGTINFNGTIINTEGISEGDVLFAKLDANGNPNWVKTFGRSANYRENTWPITMVTAPNGYSYMYGWHGDSVYFDDHLLTKPYNDPKKFMYNFFVTQIDPSGNIVWIKSIFEEHYDFNYNEMELDELGNCYIMAKFNDTIMFEDDYTVPNKSSADLFIAKYSPDGNIHWVKTIEGSSGTNWIQGLAVYDSLSLFTGGNFSTQLFFDPVTLKTTNQNGFIALLSQDRLNCMEISGTSSDYVCPEKNDGYINIAVTGGTPPLTYSWSNGESTENIEGLESGRYDVSVIDDRFCIVRKSFVLDSVIPYQGAELCMVTVNNSNKIVLVWEKDYGKYIQSYRLFREKTKNNYLQIAEVPFENLSVYADPTSTPYEMSHFYKIKAVDVCGDSSEFSPYHKSIHLWTAVGVSGEVTLTWDEYEGFFYGEYRIYRGTSLDALQEIRTISSSSQSWTDPDPPAGQVYYRVQVVKPEPCFPTANKAEEYGSTVSNYDEETIGMIVPPPGQQVTIFPNPFKERTRIRFPNPGNTSWQLIITDLSGKVVRTENNITSGEFELDRGNLVPGTYIIELGGDRVFRGKLVVQ